MAQVTNPWKGLKAYSEGEILYGRNDDIQALSQYIINNTQTVLYGKSGIGKSSILNAGVFPVARQHGLYPVPVRLEHNSDLSYVQQLSSAIVAAGLRAHEIVPVINSKEESLWEFIHRQYFTKIGDDIKVQPLFVLDQFEEIFTLQRNEKKKLIFFSQLADLLNNVCPLYIHENYNTETISSSSSSSVDLNEVTSLEDFTFDFDDEESKSETSVEYIESPAYHIVFALREDFLSYLERYTAYIPVMKKNRFGLEPINEEQAAEIIMRPCPGLVDTEVAEHIIQKVTGRSDFILDGIPEIEVDSAVLSLYLSRLFEKKNLEADKLTNELVDEFGDDIIKDFYLESISGLSPETVDILEYQLLTSDGRRDNVSRSELEASGLTADLIDSLVNDKKILRQFSYGNDIRIEYIHDILCPVISKLKEDRELEKLKLQKKTAEEIRHKENRQRNQQRVQNDLNVLTVRGRKILDNTVDFGAFENSSYISNSGCPQDFLIAEANSFLDFNFRYLHHDDVNVSSIGRLIDIGKGNLYTTCVEFKDPENHSIRTLDGISKMNVTFDGELIKQIDFIKTEKDYQGLIQEKPFYIKGFCSIALDYDEHGREIKRTYMDENHHPTPIYGGFAIIERHYDAQGNMDEVKYFDVDNNPTCHWNGNHGFASQFNEDGLEVRRMFFDTNMKITKVTSGVCGRTFEYDIEGRISYEWNLDENQHITTDNKGYIGDKFEYDEQSRLVRETYLDEKRNPMIAESGFAITITTYRGNSFTEKYLDNKGNAVSHSLGHSGVVFTVDNQFNPISYEKIFSTENGSQSSGIKELRFQWSEDGLLQNVKKYDSDGFFSGALWIRYDSRNLFILYSGDMDEKGQKVADNDGGYGSMFERDEHGFVRALWNIDRYNQLTPSDDGVWVWKINELNNGNITKWRFFDLNDRPCKDAMGAYGYALELDDKEHETVRICLDENGGPGTNDTGIQLIKKSYDENGDLIEEMNYDSQNRLCADEYGDYGTRYEYKFNPRMISVISIGEDGKPHNCNLGHCYSNSYFDEKTRIILREYLGVNGNPVPIAGDIFTIKTIFNDEDNSKNEQNIGINGDLVNDLNGIASTYSQYDELGRLILQKQYDKDGKLICDSDGDYGTAYEYSQDGRETSIISLDENGQIHANNYGYAILRSVFDEQGRVIEVYYYDVERKPTLYQDYFGYKKIYTNQDNKYIFRYLDEKGEPSLSSYNGCFAIEKEVDNKDRIIRERYLDSELKPMAVSSGIYGTHWTYNDEENSVELSRLDIDGKVMELENGVAYEFWINDDEGRKIYSCNYDINHHMVQDSIGVYGVNFSYLEDENLIKEEYLDQEKRPMLSNQGFGAINKRFDELERQIFEMRLDLDGEPSPDEAGICGFSREFLNDGRILFTNLDAENKPAPNEDGEISTLITLDDYGREISKLCLDAEGNPCTCNDGWIRIDKEYNEEGKLICNMFYDADGNPMPDKEGDYGVRLLPVEQPNEEWFAYLGKDGKPHLNQQGFASSYTLYDAQRRIIKEIFYDKMGAPILNEDGSYGYAYEYQDDGVELRYFLNEEREPMVTQNGVAYEMRKLDEKDRVIFYRRFDENDFPIPDEDGDYGFIRIYDDESRTEETIGLGENGKPHNNKHGYSSRVIELDELGRGIIDFKKTVDGDPYIDKDGWCVTKIKYDDETPGHYFVINLDEKYNVLPLKERRAYTEIFEDEQGRTTKQLWFDENGDLCPDEDGSCGIQNKYITDENGEEVCIFSYYNTKEEIITDEFGRTYYKKTVDKTSRRELLIWFNADMEPTSTIIGNYGGVFEYADDDMSILNACISLGKDYTPHNNNKGYSKELYIYDANGNSRSIYFDLDGNFVEINDND